MNPPCRFSAAALQAQRPFLRVLALGLLLDEHHAEDAVQDTIVQTIEHGPRDESGLGPWMRTACRNLALNLRRGDSRRRQRERAAEAARAAAAKDGDEGEQLRAFVVDAVVALPEPYRDAILRRYYENQPPRTIARELGVPVTTVYSRLQKGLQRLRTGLEQRRVQAGIERDSMRRSLLLLAGWPTIAPPRPPAVGILAAALVATAAIAVLLWGRLAADPRIERQAVAATPTASGGNADASATVDPLPDPMPTADVERDRVAVAAAALRVTGRALDEARRPLAGVRIEAHRAGAAVAAAASDADGRFALELTLAAHGVDEAGILLYGGDRAAVRSVPVPSITAPMLGTDRVDLGAVVLAPAERLQLQVHRTGTADDAPRIRVRLTDHVPAGELRPRVTAVYAGSYAPDPTGAIALPPLPRGTLVAEADPAGRWRGDARVPTDAEPGRRAIDLELTRVARTATAPPGGGSTGAAGEPLTWSVPAAAPDAAPQPVPIFPLLGAGHLDQPLRGELTAGMLRVAGAAGDTTAWLTVLPDGRRLRLERPATDATAPPVALVRGPRTITITLFDAEGGPVPNIPVHAVERADGPGLRAVVVSDAAGRAVFPGLHFGAIEFVILLGQWQGSPRQQPVGVIAAGTDDVAASFTFTRSRHVELQLRIDGEPRLPAAIEIATPHGLVGPLTEDSARATVGFEVWPNRGVDEVPLLVRAPGCRSAAFVVDRVPAATHEQRLDLESLGEIRVTVTAPADGEYRLALEAVPPGKRQWYTVRDVHFARVGPHAFRLEGTPAGRYRVRDRLSGTATAPFEVGRGIATTALELGDLGWATGTVTLPPDVEPSELTITDPAGERVAGLELDARNGTFRSRLAAAVPLVVRVAHPRCAAALATLTRATPCAVALRRLPDVCFRLSTGGEATVRVRVGDRRQPVVDTRITPDAAGSYSFAAPSGTHAVRIDVPGRAPIELAALEVTGTLDLGLLVPPTGLSIVVRLAVRAEMLPPTLIATIRDRDGDIVQTVTNDGRAEFAIDGLLPGPCTLELTNAAGETLHVRRQRELDVAPGMAAVAIDLRGNRKR